MTLIVGVHGAGIASEGASVALPALPSLASLYGQWRADQVTLSGSNVLTMVDLSGNARTLTAPGGSEPVQVTDGGKFAVRSQNGKYVARTRGGVGTQNYTVAYVAKIAALGLNGIFANGDDSETEGGHFHFAAATSGNRSVQHRSLGTDADGAFVAATYERHIWTYSNGGTPKLYVNGVNQSLVGVLALTAATANAEVVIGRRAATATQDAYIREVVFWEANHDASVASIDAYLAAHWS